MSDNTYNVIAPEKGVPVKAWTKGVPLEDAARKQLLNAAQLPFIFKWIAAMPDVHWGIGATVGSVIPTKGAIIPAAVGVDIGCGMMAVQTSLNARDLPDNLKGIRSAIEAAVPHGRTNHGGPAIAARGMTFRRVIRKCGLASSKLVTMPSWRSIRSSIVVTTRTTSAHSEPATTLLRSASMNQRMFGSCFTADPAVSETGWGTTSLIWLARICRGSS